MKNTILLALTLVFLFSNQIAWGQESVSETTKFAKKCHNKVKKRRFNKLKENYPKAIKKIEEIKSKADKEQFGYDAVANFAPQWIKMMDALVKFPNNQCSYKEEVITFEITDYKPLLAEAKTKANEAHYQEGIKIMNENKGNFNKQKSAFDHFKLARKYSDTHKEEMKEHCALIYYDEGKRILLEGKSYEDKKKCEEFFKKAHGWKKPYKDIVDLMAKLYFDEAENLAASDKPEEWKNALKLYNKANEWVEDYSGCKAKYKTLQEKGAEYYYAKGKEAIGIKSFESQAEAVAYFKTSREWVKNYKDAAELAKVAKKRAKVRVFYYNSTCFTTAGNYKNPIAASCVGETTEELAACTKKYSYITFPWSKKYKLFQPNPNLNVTHTQENLGGGFVMVMAERREEPTFYVSPKNVTTKKVYGYTAQYPDEKEKKVKKLTYTLGLEANKKAKTGEFRKYTGTVTTVSESISVTQVVNIEIYDMREPGKAKLIWSTTQEVSEYDKSSKETYEGSSWAKPDNLKTGGTIKNKQQMNDLIRRKSTVPGTIFNPHAKEIGEVLKTKIKYYDPEK